MEGGAGDSTVGTRVRVAVSVSSPAATRQLAAALDTAGFDAVGVDSISDLAGHVLPDEMLVVVVDDRTSNWLRAISDLTRAHPEVRPLVVADFAEPEELLAALSAGVAGFVSTTADTEAIARSIASLAENGVSIPRGMVPTLVAELRNGRHSVRTAAGRIELTHREWEILQLLVQRRSNREMADVLYVSIGTVRSHVSVLLKKLGAVDREDAIRLVERGQR